MSASTRALRIGAVLVCALCGLAVFQYWGNATHGYIATNSLLYWWVFQWVNPDSQTQHAWLILALSLFLLWRNLNKDAQSSRESPYTAALVLLLAIGLHTAGYIAQQPRISILALLLYTWGTLVLFGGSRWRRASAFPLSFMMFAIPVNALDTVGFWLQMWVVRSGEMVSHLAGIQVVRNGTQLFSPNGRFQYDVVGACSGIRSLMALMALSLFIGYLWFRPPAMRAAMLFLCFPLVYLANVLRISVIIFAANFWGQAFGDRVHDVMGMAIFVIVVGGVIGAADFLAHRYPSLVSGLAGPSSAAPRRSPAAYAPAVVAAALVIACASEAVLLHRHSLLTPDGTPGVALAPGGTEPVELPVYIGSDWMGHRVEPAAIERSILPPDTGFSRKLYLNLEDPRQRVLLSIVLSGRDRTSIHRPELCLVGQGWSIDASSQHHFDYPGKPGKGFDATVLEVHRQVSQASGLASVPEVVVYWFVGNGQVVPSQAARMLSDVWGRLVEGRAPRWAYVFLQTGAEAGKPAALDRIQGILNGSIPSFQPPAGG